MQSGVRVNYDPFDSEIDAISVKSIENGVRGNSDAFDSEMSLA